MKDISFFKRLYVWYRERYFWRLKKKKVADIFTEIYKENMWGGTPGAFYSGDGSLDANSTVYVEKVAAFISNHNIRSVLDIGCGDFTVMSKILAKTAVDYTGVDVVDELIKHHQQHYANDRTRFITLNAIDDPLPPADLVTIRQVLQHLSNEQISTILGKLKAFKYAIITEHMLLGGAVIPNIDKIPGPHVRNRVYSSVFLEAPPFNVQHAQILFEYRMDERIKGRLHPAVLRTYLITIDP